ncbi:hypothetical protein [Chitinophaga rhizosphaerae]|uniref:hypothetical protein n=1 Tax=Chitinophaga rhizosphaerae TaxID=1864947 RepID=UPI000F807315|nr:hypothetical protein [Chitinophaga rhizosphaerae]
MLTPEKIEIFKKYKGYYDGYYIQNKGKEEVISSDDWFLLSNLMQDICLIRKGLASKSFEKKVMDELIKYCINKTTYDLVFQLERYINDQGSE